MSDEDKILIQTRVRIETANFVNEQARKEHISISAWLRRIIEKEKAKCEKKKIFIIK